MMKLSKEQYKDTTGTQNHNCIKVTKFKHRVMSKKFEDFSILY